MHASFVTLLVMPFFIYILYTFVYLHFKAPSYVGVHAMANGMVMNGDGAVIADAKILPDGSIVSAKGTVIGSMYLGERYSTSLENIPPAKEKNETVSLHNGDTYELTAGYVKKEVGNRTLRMLAYNGSIPGPILKIDQNAEVTINFNNNTDIEQTIHSHGVRLDNAFDGTPGVTQDAVAPGASFSYKIKFKDAGVFWYHPHVREDYAQEMGLYGNYIVEPTDTSYWSKVNREAPLVVDDILADKDRLASTYKGLTNFALLGRFGNEHLVNGEVGYAMPVHVGEVIRFYVTNVANARTYNLSIPNTKIKLVGADLGKFEHEEFVNSVLISPAERVVVEVYFPEAGTYHLTHTSPSGSIELATFTAKDEVAASFKTEFETLRVNKDVMAELEPLRKYKYAAPDKKIALTLTTTGPKIDHSKHVHMLAGASTTLESGLPNLQWDDVGQTDMTNTSEKVTWKLLDYATRKVNGDINDWNFKKGDLVKVEIESDPNAEHVMQHPIHFHGQRFIVLSRNGVPTENLVWKDTALVFPGETVDILVEMTNPGVWMAHCHIAEHLQSGMMLNFRVEEVDGTAPGDEYRKTISGHSM